MSFFLLLNTKEDILKNDWNSIGSIDFHSIYLFFLLWKSMVPNNCLVPVVLQILLCVQQMKETHRGLEQLDGE